MMLYLQSAVVMMDCLIVLSITSHRHKHNNNAVNIITITRCLVCTCFKIIPALTTADMEWNRHGKSCYTASWAVEGFPYVQKPPVSWFILVIVVHC